MNPNTIKLILVILTAVFFIAGFVLNITSDQSLYNEDLNIVPIWQANSVLGSTGFLDFMNIVSIVFDPPVCAGYLALFWLLSSRRLEIMVFLVWFTFMCWILAILKSAIQYICIDKDSLDPSGYRVLKFKWIHGHVIRILHVLLATLGSPLSLWSGLSASSRGDTSQSRNLSDFSMY